MKATGKDSGGDASSNVETATQNLKEHEESGMHDSTKTISVVLQQLNSKTWNSVIYPIYNSSTRFEESQRAIRKHRKLFCKVRKTTHEQNENSNKETAIIEN